MCEPEGAGWKKQSSGHTDIRHLFVLPSYIPHLLGEDTGTRHGVDNQLAYSRSHIPTLQRMSSEEGDLNRDISIFQV